MRQKLSAGLVITLCMALLPVPAGYAAPSANVHRHVFQAPIDAVSVGIFDGKTTAVSIRGQISNGAWTDWQESEIDFDTETLTETALTMFPEKVGAIEVRSPTTSYVVHPITVSSAPARHLVASLVAANTQRILSRSDWGADESFLVTSKSSSASSSSSSDSGTNGDNGSVSSGRIEDCNKARTQYPDEFSIGSTVTKSATGQEYRWPIQYSPSIRLFVVHHTALLAAGETRSGAERMRALYQYHANSRGWGDVGYNYIIDETGNIYEGRNGGKYAVAGHAYCNNVGTLGIALMGNFEIEQPSQDQVRALQWLVGTLAKQYNINPNEAVQFHGKKFISPVAAHRDLLSTSCPGYYMHGALGQVIAHIQQGDLFASVTFPALRSGDSKKQQTAISGQVAPEQIAIVGRTTITSNPGGKQRISFAVHGGETGIRAGRRIATITKSSQNIIIWQEEGAQEFEVTAGISLPYDVPSGEQTVVSLIVQAPWDSGNFTLNIGSLHYTLSVTGRRARTGTFVSPFTARPETLVKPSTRRTVAPSTSTIAAMQRLQMRTPKTGQLSSSTSSVSSATSTVSTPLCSGTLCLRIKLTVFGDSPTIRFPGGGTIGANNHLTAAQRATVSVRGSQCSARLDTNSVDADILNFVPDVRGYITIEGNGKTRTYRGRIECRVIDAKPVLINQLLLEDYLQGLAEEPDTEPFEKQRAFAIAARTYALYYTDAAHRKFPGQPYDGDDSPANFQSYAGVEFETANPQWVRAVAATSGKTLMYQNQVLRVPYFSADDGRTRSPSEAGWNNFPFSEVFASKPDPWCAGQALRGHGVGMSGCGALGQAKEGKTAEQILQYYYPGATIITQ